MLMDEACIFLMTPRHDSGRCSGEQDDISNGLFPGQKHYKSVNVRLKLPAGGMA